VTADDTDAVNGVPVEVEIEVQTPLEAKPTMSALASPVVMFASSRGKRSLLLQPPVWAPQNEVFDPKVGAAKLPLPVARDT
jgi:hypothetical protein